MKRLGILVLVAAALAAASAGSVLAVKQDKVATNPATISFGSVAIGSASGWSIGITNNTKRSITYQGVSADAPFSFNGQTCDGATLAPGASCLATIEFRPTTVGTVSGVVTTLWTSGHRPLSSDVSVSGTGYVPEIP